MAPAGIEDGEPLMRTTLLKLLFGPRWAMVRRKVDGSLEVIRKPSAR